jgi:undecaprenyl pyrophosphate phosphatase UppP
MSGWQKLHKYWWMILLATVPCAYIVTLLEPSLERSIEKIYVLAWAAILLYYIFGRFETIEKKLDAILAKLNEK